MMTKKNIIQESNIAPFRENSHSITEEIRYKIEKFQCFFRKELEILQISGTFESIFCCNGRFFE